MRKQSARGHGRYITIVAEGDRRGAAHIINAIGNRVSLMEAKGYSKKQQNDYVFKVLRDLERGKMNEGVLDSLTSLLGWASEKKYLQPIQSWIGGKIAAMLFIPPGSILHKIVVNFIENMEFSKVQQMFSGEGACRPLVSELVGAMQEAIAEQGLAMIGLAPQSMLGKFVQETFLASFTEEGPIVDKITDVVCSLNISDIFARGKADVKAAITGGASAPA